MSEREKWAQMLNAELAGGLQAQGLDGDGLDGDGLDGDGLDGDGLDGDGLDGDGLALSDQPAQKAYGNEIKKLVLHMQGIHKIFKSIPEYAFPDRLGKQRALMPIEHRIDSLIAREREDAIA